MKLRHPLLIKAAGFGAAWAVRVWIGTLGYRYRALGRIVIPTEPDLRERYIYAFWHENLLLPAYHFSRPDVWVLISQHADGELIAEACRNLRLRLVRGSTTRGGVQAVRQMIKLGRRGHLVITPDGPRGPRRRVQQGLVYLAAKTGLPIVPVGVGFDRPWRLSSWDRFALPRPWSLGTLVTADPIRVPENTDREAIETYRRSVEEAMGQATDAAERLARKAG
jgi:lysophospholipid acyltransferase (LPLAT)-like uncharacterized protein